MTFENVPIRMNGKNHAEKLKYNRQESLGILFQSLKKNLGREVECDVTKQTFWLFC